MDGWNGIVWGQFGAAIDMLDGALSRCPPKVWDDPDDDPYQRFWYLSYHCLFFLDLYLTGESEGWRPPEPFSMSEADPRGILPERTYTKEELRGYLAFSREKCRTTLAALTDEQARRIHRFPWGAVSFGELLLDNMRHVQHHTAQLNVALRKKADTASPWIASIQKV